MNVTLRLLVRAVAGWIPGLLLLVASVLRAADVVEVFAKAELGIDLARYPSGSSVASFPDLEPPYPKVLATDWRRMKIQRPNPAGTHTSAFLDLRFENDRLVELRTMGFEPGASTPQNARLLAAFQRLGPGPVRSNSNRFVVETKEWRMSAEGFCSNTNPIVVQFHITAPPQRRSPP